MGIEEINKIQEDLTKIVKTSTMLALAKTGGMQANEMKQAYLTTLKEIINKKLEQYATSR